MFLTMNGNTKHNKIQYKDNALVKNEIFSFLYKKKNAYQLTKEDIKSDIENQLPGFNTEKSKQIIDSFNKHYFEKNGLKKFYSNKNTPILRIQTETGVDFDKLKEIEEFLLNKKNNIDTYVNKQFKETQKISDLIGTKINNTKNKNAMI